jgi:ABC-type Fe3+-hydroxamate transport system substrate-binding protein
MTLLRLIVLALSTVATAACGSGSTLPESDADLSGTVAEFAMESPDASTAVLVERQDPGAADRTIVHVQPEARVYLVGRGGRLTAADADDLALGDQLQVWTTGVELRSYPGQVFATRVHIFREGVSN